MYRAEPILIYHNNGNGTFTDVTREIGLDQVLGKGMGIALADIDGDGFVDAFIANDNDRNLLLHNLGNRMKEIGIEAGIAYNGDGRRISGMGADFADIDGDGLPDIVMTGLRGETYELFRNRGDGTFDEASASSGLLALSRQWNGWGCGLVDLDNDGWLDLFVACGGLDSNEPQPNRIFRNQNGHWSDVSADVGTEFSTARLHRGAAFADFDNDGRMDAAVTAINAPIELWMNRSPARHWLQMKLTGARSNHSAIGAQITCKAGRSTQVRTVTNSIGYASSSDLRVHFGLGDERTAALEIRWPSGTVQKIERVQADQQIQIVEPVQSPAPTKHQTN